MLDKKFYLEKLNRKANCTCRRHTRDIIGNEKSYVAEKTYPQENESGAWRC